MALDIGNGGTSQRELQAALERLAQENQVLRQGQASMVTLAESVGRLANNMQRGDRKLLIDMKGIGRPEVFPNEHGRVSNRSLNRLLIRMRK